MFQNERFQIFGGDGLQLLTELRNELQSGLDLSGTISPMQLSQERNSIALRPSPSSDNSFKLDGARTYNFSVQVLTKSESWMVAWNDIQKIHEFLINELDLSHVTKVDATTNPNFVDSDEQNNYYFSGIYNLEYERS